MVKSRVSQSWNLDRSGSNHGGVPSAIHFVAEANACENTVSSPHPSPSAPRTSGQKPRRRSARSLTGLAVVALFIGAPPASACLSAERRQAASQNPNTDWLQRAGYGVFVHYLAGLQNNADRIHSLGRQTAWDDCVREFDMQRFADAMAEAGAGYVIFTMQQR